MKHKFFRLFTTLALLVFLGGNAWGQDKPEPATPFPSEGTGEITKFQENPDQIMAGGTTLLNGGNRLVSLQNNDGGWDWPLDDGNPANVSPKNTIGPIGKGLARAYNFTGNASMKTALQNAGVLLLAKTNNFSPSDGYLAAQLDKIFGVTTYTTHLTTNFYGPLAAGTYNRNGSGTLYNTTGYITLIRNNRSGTIANLAAWDVGMGLVGAASCGVSGTELGYWKQGVKDEINELDGLKYYDVIGLAGAIYGLAFVGESFDPTAGEHATAGSLADLAAILASYQISNGGFAWNKDKVIPNDGNEAVQETGYSILALNQFNRSTYLPEIIGAADYLSNVQLPTGGWANYVGSGENNEVTAEALWGIAEAYCNVWVDDAGSDANDGSYEFPFKTIQYAVSQVCLGGTVNVMPGTYNERVTINKSLTLEGQDEATVILNGTGLVGTGNGITINNNVTNVIIKTLSIKNYDGVSGNINAGIYAIGGNNNLTIQHVTLADNRGTTGSGSGFYANGPVDNVLLDYITSSGHYPGARGIVIWNGLKTNITITNCEVFNNNCCGIELQDGTASGVLMENNNVYNNGDNGFGLMGLQGPGENLIKNNTVTNCGRFGIEIKNPNGSGLDVGSGRIVVENNTVTRTNPIGAEHRDIVAITSHRRAVLAGNVDVPYGSIIRNNTISGYQQPSSSDGFGIVVEGINHSVLNNNISGCDVGIQQQVNPSNYPGDADQSNLADQYFGRGNSPVSCGITILGNTFASNGTDTRFVGATSGSGFVLNTTTGKTFCSIQSAIDDATTLNGHTLKASTGTFTESPNVNKELTITAASTPVLLGMFTINANNVTIDGFGINNSNGTNAIIVKGKSNITIKNNTIHIIGAIPVGNIHAVLMDLGNSASNNIQILNNEIFNIGSFNSTGSVSAITAGFSNANYDLTGLLIKDNKLHHIRANNSTISGGKGAYGILLNVGAITGSGKVNDPVILNNEIYELEGFWAHGIGLETKTPNAVVSFNKLYNIVCTKTTPGPDAFGVLFEANPNAHTVKVNFNSFSNMLFGMGVHPTMAQPSNNIDGRFNWWGDCSGPSPIGDTRCTETAAGSGVGVSCWIDYAPWLGGSFTGLSSILHLNSAYFFVNGLASGTNVNSWPYNWCPGTNAATSPAPNRDPLYAIASPPMVEFYTNLSAAGHGWGSSDVMEINYDGTITSTQTDIMQPDGNPKTLFVAFKPESDNNNTRQVIFEAGETTSGFNIYTDNDMLAFGMWNRLERRYVLLGSPALNMGQYYLAQLEYDGTTFSGLLDGSLQSPQLGFSGLTKDPDDASGQPSVGIAGEVHGTRFHDYNIFTQNYAHTFNGGIGDVLLFNGILTQAQMNEVYAYFNAKYGQSWTAPTGYAKRGDWFVVAENEGTSSLSQAYPNPFSSSTQFIVDLQSEQNVIIELYNSIGELVSLIHNGKLGKGPSIFTIDGSQLAPGMYAYRVSAEGFVQSGKVILIK